MSSMERAYVTNPRIIKAMLIFSWLMVLLAIDVLIKTSPISHYELSIYSSVPVFWILILVSSSVLITSILYQVYIKNYDQFLISFVGLLFCDSIILLLPFVRGYFLYGGNDPNAHLKLTQDIILYGNISENYYPFTHVLSAELIEVSLCRPETIIKLIPPIFSVLFICFMYYFALEISKRKDCAVFSAVIGSIPLFSYYHIVFYPHALAVSLFPISFYLYFKSTKDTSYRLLFLIFVISIPFIHAVPAVIFICCLAAAEIATKLCSLRNITVKRNATYKPILISLITWIMWWSSYAVFGRVTGASNWFIRETKEIPRTGEVVPIFNLDTYEWMQLFIKMYAHQLIYSIISVIIVGIVFIQFLKKNNDISNYFVLSAIVSASVISYILVFLSSGVMTVGRFLGANISIWAMPVMVALFFIKLSIRKFGLLLITLIIIFASINATLSMYRSSWILQPNWQFTYQDAYSNDWVPANRIVEAPLEGLGYAWIGTSIGTTPIGAWSWKSKQGNIFIPIHFGYYKNATLRESLPLNAIIYLGEFRQRLASNDTILTKSPLCGVWMRPNFEDKDIYKLNNDFSVNFIYSNGDNEILFVK